MPATPTPPTPHLIVNPDRAVIADATAPLQSRLTHAAPLLSGRRQEAALSIAARRILSPGQEAYARILIDAALNPQPTPLVNPLPATALPAILDLFARAATRLRRPAIMVAAGDTVLRLSVAGPSARVPGSINVAGEGSFAERKWYGRITPEGFQPSHHATPAVTAALASLAADPAAACSAYGHLTGACCFCRLPLTDARSVAVGYGPICAGNFGLPWGV